MLGHYLGTLTEAQEDRVLTLQMQPVLPWAPYRDSCGVCLVATALGYSPSWIEKDTGSAQPMRGYVNYRHSPAYRYEDLCQRFGAPRVNAAIRSRILSNRVRRMLTSAREVLGSVGAVPGRPQESVQ